MEPHSVPEDAIFAFRINRDDTVAFRGALDQASAASHAGAGMLYPAPDPLSFLVAVGTHAALVSTDQNRRLGQQQEAANQVLAPYRSVLDQIGHGDLLRAATEHTAYPRSTRIIEPDEVDKASWIVETLPVFAMTQDQSAFVLDNAIRVFKPGNSKQPAYQNMVRVVSIPAEGSDPQAAWTASDGARLKAAAQRQFSRSLELAIMDVTTDLVSPQAHKTLRYVLGTVEKMERGQVLQDDCGEIVLRTLRGWVMSVPKSATPDPDAGSCISGRLGAAQ
ncbi:MAG: hypothetical protein KIS79_07405 [Burkholderiales bacterium]|nr:hypothetical protein [Burkholderiales bacterium]